MSADFVGTNAALFAGYLKLRHELSTTVDLNGLDEIQHAFHREREMVARRTGGGADPDGRMGK